MRKYYTIALLCALFVVSTKSMFGQIKFKNPSSMGFYIDTTRSRNCETGNCIPMQLESIALFRNTICGNSLLYSAYYPRHHNGVLESQIPQDSMSQIPYTLGFLLYIPASISKIEHIHTADLNNDQLQDVLVGNSSSIGVFFQPTQGYSNTFDASLSYQDFSNSNSVFWIDTTLRTIEAIALGDLNSDNRTDILVLQANKSECTIYYQTNKSQFTKSVFSIPTNTSIFSHIEIADMNNDSRNDIVLLLNNNVYLFAQTPDHSFNNYSLLYENPVALPDDEFPMSQINYSSFALGHLNNDLRTDIVLLGDQKSSLLLYQDSVSCSFSNSVDVKVFGSVVKIADLNNDLTNEIVALDRTTLFIVEQNAKQQYTDAPNTLLNTIYSALDMVIGDVNNDGLKDVAIAGSPVAYYINASKPKVATAATGRDKVCNDSVFSYRKSRVLAKPIIWQISPRQAATMVSSNADSCMVQWSKTWAGRAVLQWAQVDGCDTVWSDSLVIAREFSEPQVNMPLNLILCVGDTLSLNAKTDRCSYFWSTGSRDAKILIHNHGEYSVTVRNACGMVQRTVVVDGCDVSVPSAFSPNGDRVNDELLVVGKNISNIQFRVFNRWGEIIFESFDFTTAWDGTQNGTPLEAAVFNYTLSATSDADGHLIQKKGTISLVR